MLNKARIKHRIQLFLMLNKAPNSIISYVE